jgi:hypothetical protein
VHHFNFSISNKKELKGICKELARNMSGISGIWSSEAQANETPFKYPGSQEKFTPVTVICLQ